MQRIRFVCPCNAGGRPAQFFKSSFVLLEIFLGGREIARANPMNTEQVHGGIERKSAVEGERIAYLPNCLLMIVDHSTLSRPGQIAICTL